MDMTRDQNTFEVGVLCFQQTHTHVYNSNDYSWDVWWRLMESPSLPGSVTGAPQ